MIVSDIEESYRKLIYKVTFGISTILSLSRNLLWIVKLDDDVLVNLNLLEKTILENQSSEILCQINKNGKPHREESSKYHLPKNQFLNEVFPEYCKGPMYILQKSGIEKILSNFENHKGKVLWLEDLFLTGILASNISKKDLTKSFLNVYPDYSIEKLNQIVGIHMKESGTGDLIHFWQKLFRPSQNFI